MAVFDDLCNKKGIVINLKMCGVEEFKGVLCRFYPGLRTKSGDFYKKSSYLAARASIGHYITVDLQHPFDLFQTVQPAELHVFNLMKLINAPNCFRTS